jgi:hypothetical protein
MMKYNIVDFTENILNIKLPNYQKKLLKLMEVGKVNKNSNIIKYGGINVGYVTHENRKGRAVKKHSLLFEFAVSVYVSVFEQSLHIVPSSYKSFLYILSHVHTRCQVQIMAKNVKNIGAPFVQTRKKRQLIEIVPTL